MSRGPITVTRLSMNLGNARRKMNWTQMEVANQMWCAQSKISDWELGRSVPSEEQLQCLAKVYHTSVEELKK
jgi:transcriptional regulator with XRE-family HTH domain